MTASNTATNGSGTILLSALLKIEIRIWSLLTVMIARDANLQRVMRRTLAKSTSRYAALSQGDIARRVKKALRKPVFMSRRQCFREGLLLRRFLALAGLQPEICFGVDTSGKAPENGNDFAAHCWIICNGQVYMPPDSTMHEVVRYGLDGTPQTRKDVP